MMGRPLKTYSCVTDLLRWVVVKGGVVFETKKKILCIWYPGMCERNYKHKKYRLKSITLIRDRQCEITGYKIPAENGTYEIIIPAAFVVQKL